MRLRRMEPSLGVLLVLTTLGLVGVGATTAQAAPAARAAPAAPNVVFGPPAEGAKITLADTSSDGPALWTNPTGSPRAILAWTGRDAAHRLNYMTSDDGLHYGNKHTLVETSPFRPSVTVVGAGQTGTIVLAWTGTDVAHTLNLLYINASNDTPIQKVTLRGETSFTAPAVEAWLGSEPKLAWAGMDPNHSLNIITMSPSRQVMDKTTLREQSSKDAPTLSQTVQAAPTFLVLWWVRPDSRIDFAQWTAVGPSNWQVMPPLAEWSNWAPSMKSAAADGQNMPRDWLAWGGTLSDTAHHLNVQYTEHFPDWTNVNSKTTLRETELGSPAMGYVGVIRQMLVAWTGTDAAHHLNVAIITV